MPSCAMVDLVPGRECGECNLCCIVPAIDGVDIQKRSGVACRHCRADGCAIYEGRPDVCRKYYCAWRRLSIFDESWRPDKSEVLAEIETEMVPPEAAWRFGICLVLVGNPLRTLRKPWFIDFVVRGVNRNIALFLGLPGPNGFQGAKLLLNNRAMREAAPRGRAAVKPLLEKALRQLSAHHFVPEIRRQSGNDVGVPDAPTSPS